LGTQSKIGSRDPNKKDIAQWISDHTGEEGKASAGSFAEAAAFAELLVLATLWDGIPNVIKIADQKNFVGKNCPLMLLIHWTFPKACRPDWLLVIQTLVVKQSSVCYLSQK
jgi:hypothetical protein